jgi:UDP-2,3-diacylglucosamine pyrophosphatase LpxH
MDALKRVTEVFKSSQQILFDDSSRIVLMSDCHRGDGSWTDDFSRNQNPYFAALTHYYNENYTYIELGDGDELWENSRFSDIKQVHSDVFWLLSKFYNKGRLYLIYGNHDMVKRDKGFVKNNLYQYYSESERRYVPLFKNIQFYEGLILRHRDTKDEIFLVHGHQVDCLNDRLWKLARFLVRYFWKPLSTLGINDPTRAAKNYEKKEAIEKILTEWVVNEKHMLIAGHTHRPMFPETGEPPYFNDGSCVHPRCITAIEITNGYIVLVKWNVQTKTDGTLFIGREVLAGPRRLSDYFIGTVKETKNNRIRILA